MRLWRDVGEAMTAALHAQQLADWWEIEGQWVLQFCDRWPQAPRQAGLP